MFWLSDPTSGDSWSLRATGPRRGWILKSPSDLVIVSYYPQVYSLKFDINPQLFRGHDHESTQSSFKFKKIRAMYFQNVEDLLSLSISYLSDPSSKVGYIWTHTYPKPFSNDWPAGVAFCFLFFSTCQVVQSCPIRTNSCMSAGISFASKEVSDMI